MPHAIPMARVAMPSVGKSSQQTKISSNRAQLQHPAPRRLLLDAQPSMEQQPNLLFLPVSPAGDVQQPLISLADYYSAVHWHAPLASSLLTKSTSQIAHTPVQETFGVQLNEPPQPPGREKHSDFYANVGDAIRTLRDDIPLLFAKELNWAIYREDVVFRDPNISFKGLENYKLIFWSLRFHGRLFFKKLHVEVTRIWQPEDKQIKMRWKVYAVPRVWWEAEGTFDGISTYKLDNEGKIYEHMVDNVQLRDPPITNPLLYGLNFVMGPRLQPQQMPCPGSWFVDDDQQPVGPAAS